LGDPAHVQAGAPLDPAQAAPLPHDPVPSAVAALPRRPARVWGARRIGAGAGEGMAPGLHNPAGEGQAAEEPVEPHRPALAPAPPPPRGSPRARPPPPTPRAVPRGGPPHRPPRGGARPSPPPCRSAGPGRPTPAPPGCPPAGRATA